MYQLVVVGSFDPCHLEEQVLREVGCIPASGGYSRPAGAGLPALPIAAPLQHQQAVKPGVDIAAVGMAVRAAGSFREDSDEVAVSVLLPMPSQLHRQQLRALFVWRAILGARVKAVLLRGGEGQEALCSRACMSASGVDGYSSSYATVVAHTSRSNVSGCLAAIFWTLLQSQEPVTETEVMAMVARQSATVGEVVLQPRAIALTLAGQVRRFVASSDAYWVNLLGGLHVPHYPSPLASVKTLLDIQDIAASYDRLTSVRAEHLVACEWLCVVRERNSRCITIAVACQNDVQSAQRLFLATLRNNSGSQLLVRYSLATHGDCLDLGTVVRPALDMCSELLAGRTPHNVALLLAVGTSAVEAGELPHQQAQCVQHDPKREPTVAMGATMARRRASPSRKMWVLGGVVVLAAAAAAVAVVAQKQTRGGTWMAAARRAFSRSRSHSTKMA